MGIALAVIGGLLVGLPLIALAAGRWLPPTRSRPGAPDPTAEFAREHGLAGLDMVRVQEAVEQGRAAPPRLRRAAVAYAEYVLTFDEWGAPPRAHRRTRRVQLVLVGTLGVLCVLVVYTVVEREFTFLLPQALLWTAFIPLQRLARRRRNSRARASIGANRLLDPT